MAWRLKPAPYSGKGTSGRNALDSLEFLVFSDNPAADQATSEVAMLTFISSQVGVGAWGSHNNGFYFGHGVGASFVYTIPYAGPGSFVSISPTIIDHIDRELVSPVKGTWKINVVYRDAVITRQTGDAEFSGSTGGGTLHIISAIPNGTTQFPAPGKTAPASGTLIGCTQPGQPPTGIDIDVPAFRFKTTYYISSAQLQAFFATYASLLGPVSNKPVTFVIRGVALITRAFELKFEGGEFQERIGQGDWALTLNWAHSPNKTSFAVSGITVTFKGGWDYLEVVPMPFADTASNTTTSQATCVNVHQVYFTDDLNALIPNSTIGTSPPWA